MKTGRLARWLGVWCAAGVLTLAAAGCNLERNAGDEEPPAVEDIAGTAGVVDTPASDLDAFGATSTARLQATPTQASPPAAQAVTAVPTPTPFVLSPVPDVQQPGGAVTAAASTTASNLPATPNPDEPGGFRIESNFDAPRSTWISEGDEIVSRGYENGIYYLGIESPDGTMWGYTLGPKSGDTPPRDVVIEADVRLSQGGGSVSYGFLCRRTEGENYYFFVLSNTGQAQIGRMSANQATPLTDWLPVSSAQPPQDVNRLRIGCVGDVLWLEINGDLVAQVQDSAFAEGDYGLFMMNNRGGAARADYDNARIVGR